VRDPIQPFLDLQDAFILDGGLATELEALGSDLSDELWSARLLADDPDLIRRVHLAYFEAGADCAITASYQASVQGFMARGMSEEEATGLLRLSVRLAIEARDEFWRDKSNREGRLRPLVAASIGPYGAFLADGSEYSGNYELDEQGLLDWHRQRWQILAGCGADLLACETIPSYGEMRALHHLLKETPGTLAWFSFSCRDGLHISDGTPIARCASRLSDSPQVVAIGVNCTAPRFIPGLISELRRVTSKHILVYPNSGETYDAENQRWLGLSDASEFGTLSREWRKEGAAMIGGCCRTGPNHIRQIAARMRRGRELNPQGKIE
jgi:homocysteine S-methyltransferase